MKTNNTIKCLKHFLLLCLTYLSFPVQAQFTTVAIQDFDTIQTPVWGYTLTSGTLQFVNGNSATTDYPASSPLGIGGSWAWKEEGQSGGVTLTFNNITTTGYDTTFLTFRVAAFGLGGTGGVDAADYLTATVSINNGTNWYDQVKLTGNSNSYWAYTGAATANRTFSTSAVSTFAPAAGGLATVDAYTTVIIKVPNTTNQVRLRITERSSTSSERWCVDNVEIKINGVTLNNASVTGLVSPINFCAGYQDIKVRIANKGKNIINNVNVNWRLNGVLQTPIFWTSPLDTLGGLGKSDTVLTLTNMFLGITPNTLKVWTSDPNYVADGFPQDDTINVVLKSSLNGTYTVGGSTPDYATLALAVNDLNSFGVCGPVVFNVAAGTYSGQLILNSFQGASPVNTVIFNGASAASTIITSSISSAAAVIINQSQYVTFRNFTISNTFLGSCTGVGIVGSASGTGGTGSVIKNCMISLPNAYGYVSYGINVSNAATGYGGTGIKADSIKIDSNTINGAYYAIYINGNDIAPSPAFNRDYKIRGNTITNSYYIGVYCYSIYNAITVSGNIINMDSLGDLTSMGIYISYCLNSNTGTFHQISRNFIKNAGGSGIYLSYSDGTANNPTRLTNNMISGGFRYNYAFGIYVEENVNSYLQIYHNSVNLDFAQTSSMYAALYFYGSANVKIKNNIFATTALTGSALPIYIDFTLPNGNVNNNLYYNASGPNLLYKNLTLFSSLNYKTLAAGGDSSYNSIPSFADSKNLHVSNGCIRGTNLNSIVPDDIDGDLRTATPLMGADEILLYSNNMAVEGIVSPVAPIATGYQDLIIRVQNMGSNIVYNFDIAYKVNAGTPVSQLWAFSLNTCDTTSVLFSSSNQVNLSNMNNLTVYTSNPNYLTDTYKANDTLKLKLYTPLNGTYTIGPVASDFPTFSSAAEALKIAGVSGPVTFNVRTGTYTDSLLFNNAIAGMSSTNTVTFRSMANHADSVILTLNSASVPVVIFNNVDNFIIRFITLNAPNINFGRVYVLGGTASNNVLENCTITGASGGGYETIFASGVTGRKNSIRNNIISNGSSGIYYYGASPTYADSILIEGNTIQNATNYSLYLMYTRNLLLRNNIITGTTAYGIRCTYGYDALEISGNKITISGTYGMYLYNNAGTATAGALIANNVVNITGNYGIRNQTSSYMRFYNNTISVTGNYGVYINYAASYGNNSWRNNIIHTSSISNTAYAAFITNNGTNNTWDYNLYYNLGTSLFSAYTTLPLWRTASGQDLNSIKYRPAFMSATNLAPNPADTACWALNGRGVQLTANPIDLLGNPRSITLSNGAPDLGAYEFTPTSLPPQAISPSAPVSGTTQAFFFAGDTVASILWAPFSTVPGSVMVRYYSGTFHPNSAVSNTRMNSYWDIQDIGSGTYDYTLSLYYNEALKGSISTESDMRMAKMQFPNPWVLFSGTLSVVDTVKNILKAPGLTNFSSFTGTEPGNNPLPVKLISLNASAIQNDVSVSWTTATEINVSHFIIEASTDGNRFESVGKVKAKGNSSRVCSYNFSHINARAKMGAPTIIYYRLNAIDLDGKSEISGVVSVNFEKGNEDILVFPNPFTHEVFVNLNAAENGNVILNITDITGKNIQSQTLKVSAGMNLLTINILNELKPGIYFMEIMAKGGEKWIRKVIRE